MLLQCGDFLSRIPQPLYQTLQQADSLLLVSNVCTFNDIEFSSWIITDSLGNKFVEGNSPPIPGINPDPMGQKATQQWPAASSLSINTYAYFANTLNQLPRKTLYCNILGLKRKLNYFFTYRLAPIKCILHSEYKVLLVKPFLLPQEYTATRQILFVKGHQDDRTPHPILPPPAQLNCESIKKIFRIPVSAMVLHMKFQ
jgi:hypothetical protein